jgi:hypothetical protein
MKAPHGFAEIVKAYGDPRPYIKTDGTMRSDWEIHTLATARLPGAIPLSWDPSVKVRRMRCHFLLVPIVTETFDAIHAAGLWDALREFGGCYAARAQRGSTKPSLHLWGAAIDLNPSTNGLGTEGDMSPSVVRVFEEHGWTWGGRFGRPDPMHFQFATGY